jgi:hypothetical protein
MLGHSSIVLTADTCTSVLPDVAYRAAEKVASLVLKAGCLIPGIGHRRQRQTRRKKAQGRAGATPVTKSSRPADRPPATAAEPRRSHLTARNCAHRARHGLAILVIRR